MSFLNNPPAEPRPIFIEELYPLLNYEDEDEWGEAQNWDDETECDGDDEGVA